VKCSFDVDARVCISKNMEKNPLTKEVLHVCPIATRALLSGSQTGGPLISTSRVQDNPVRRAE